MPAPLGIRSAASANLKPLRQPVHSARERLARLPVLDALRGLAILLVFFYHYWAMPSSTSGSVAYVLAALMHGMWIGVDLFFVLSGFLITRILRETRDAPHYFRDFYARRALRIFPLYGAVLAVVFFLFPSLFSHPPGAAIAPYQWWLWTYLMNYKAAFDGTTLFVDRSLRLSHFLDVVRGGAVLSGMAVDREVLPSTDVVRGMRVDGCIAAGGDIAQLPSRARVRGVWSQPGAPVFRHVQLWAICVSLSTNASVRAHNFD
jgi:hypothetical protein